MFDFGSPIRWEILGNIIYIKKLFIYFYIFIYFQRARAFFPREEGTRKSFSVADGLRQERSDFEVWPISPCLRARCRLFCSLCSYLRQERSDLEVWPISPYPYLRARCRLLSSLFSYRKAGKNKPFMKQTSKTEGPKSVLTHRTGSLRINLTPEL